MPNKNRPATLDHLKKKKPLERKVFVVRNDEVLDAYYAAEAELDRRTKEYDSWLAEARDLQMRVLQTMPQAAKELFLRELPDPPGAEDRQKVVSAAKEALSAAKEAVEEATSYILVRSIGRKPYEALVAEHPATDEQNVEHQAEHGTPAPYNGDTFPPALVAASVVEPKMTLEDAQEIWDTWNNNEIIDLFTNALLVNTHRRASLGNG